MHLICAHQTLPACSDNPLVNLARLFDLAVVLLSQGHCRKQHNSWVTGGLRTSAVFHKWNGYITVHLWRRAPQLFFFFLEACMSKGEAPNALVKKEKYYSILQADIT